MEAERFYRLREVAAALGISVRTLSDHLKAGEVPHTRFGRAILIPASFLEQKRLEASSSRLRRVVA